MEKSLNSPASLRPTSLTSSVLKLFERTILLRLLFFLESNSILSPRKLSFRLGRFTLDQILFFSQSILDEFNKSKPGSRTILATITFSKAFDSAWLPLFSKNLFRPASLVALLVGLNLSFLIGALAWFFKITKVAPSITIITKVARLSRCSARIRSWLCAFSFFINDLSAFLPSSDSCSFYADNLTISSFFPSICIKLLFGHFSLMLHPYGFLFLVLPTQPNWNAFTERLVAPLPATFRSPLTHSSLRRLYFASKSP